ncbi:hypothetical protein BB560_000422 [Smittium megazygosporum]|uniref:Uncharacterized protein n=1 Tax=Smittium megazygosporum TaxID=133381 RepID=A0A2T9ZKB2_9FUNG|nr:hypothetical protein BB560_000422 [Smittium megazygosporum]
MEVSNPSKRSLERLTELVKDEIRMASSLNQALVNISNEIDKFSDKISERCQRLGISLPKLEHAYSKTYALRNTPVPIIEDSSSIFSGKKVRIVVPDEIRFPWLKIFDDQDINSGNNEIIESTNTESFCITFHNNNSDYSSIKDFDSLKGDYYPSSDEDEISLENEDYLLTTQDLDNLVSKLIEQGDTENTSLDYNISQNDIKDSEGENSLDQLSDISTSNERSLDLTSQKDAIESGTTNMINNDHVQENNLDLNQDLDTRIFVQNVSSTISITYTESEQNEPSSSSQPDGQHNKATIQQPGLKQISSDSDLFISPGSTTDKTSNFDIAAENLTTFFVLKNESISDTNPQYSNNSEQDLDMKDAPTSLVACPENIAKKSPSYTSSNRSTSAKEQKAAKKASFVRTLGRRLSKIGSRKSKIEIE